MSALLAKIRKSQEKTKHAERPRVHVDAEQQVTPRFYERPTTLAACARLYRQYDKQIKSMQRMADELKRHIRDAGVQALRQAESEGKYYGMAQVGCCKVVRQNKYQPLEVERSELVDAVGMAEYGVLFTEKVCIELASVDALKQFQSMCELAGVKMPGVPVVSIKPKAGFAERKCELAGALSGSKRTTIEAIADGESLPSVSWK